MATVANKAGYSGMSGAEQPMRSPTSLLGPANTTNAVVPSDTVNLPFTASDLQVGVGGTITLVKPDGTTQAYTAASGEHLAVRFIRVNATGTTATNMVASL